MQILDYQDRGPGGIADEAQQPFEVAHQIAGEVERLAGGAGDVPERQQHFGSGEVFAGAPMDERVPSTAFQEVFDQGCLAGTRFAGDGDDASLSSVRSDERLTQTVQMIIPL
jgi:hypothetical protein